MRHGWSFASSLADLLCFQIAPNKVDFANVLIETHEHQVDFRRMRSVTNRRTLDTMSANKDSVRDALNKHGVFLKKAVIAELYSMKGLQIYGEEVGTSFGGTRVADIAIQEDFGTNQPKLFFVIECKRAEEGKQWVFFKHIDRKYRVSRVTDDASPSSKFNSATASQNRVCSEGYEFPVKDGNRDADQSPVFKAAAQLSAAYVGFIHSRRRRRYPERYVPILVTTAQLFIVDDWPKVPLATGRLNSELKRTEVSELILKHPFPTPAGVEEDFRTKIDSDPDPQRVTESIHVVRATELRAFLRPELRQEWGME